jgi:hypothetical protein
MNSMQQALVRAVERQPAPREDLYTGIHKAMRALVCDTLVAAGRMDTADEAEVAQTLGRVRLMIELSRHHLHHENQHVHPAMEARRRGASAAAARGHAEHVQAFERLEALALRVERNRGPARDSAALDLYRELALHAAEDFRHMHAEETENNAVLWEHCSDEELKGIHQAILASVGPRQMTDYLVWFARAMTPAERAALLSGMRQALPSEVFSGVTQLVKSVLGERDWAKVIAALGSRPLAV